MLTESNFLTSKTMDTEIITQLPQLRGGGVAGLQ